MSIVAVSAAATVAMMTTIAFHFVLKGWLADLGQPVESGP